MGSAYAAIAAREAGARAAAARATAAANSERDAAHAAARVTERDAAYAAARAAGRDAAYTAAREVLPPPHCAARGAAAAAAGATRTDVAEARASFRVFYRPIVLFFSNCRDIFGSRNGPKVVS